LTGGDKGLTPKRGDLFVFSRRRDGAVTGVALKYVYDGNFSQNRRPTFPGGAVVAIAPPYKISVKPAERWEKPALSAA
jgi:hypothetical protein